MMIIEYFIGKLGFTLIYIIAVLESSCHSQSRVASSLYVKAKLPPARKISFDFDFKYFGCKKIHPEFQL